MHLDEKVRVVAGRGRGLGDGGLGKDEKRELFDVVHCNVENLRGCTDSVSGFIDDGQ
jgi:hypothetical protein